MNPDTKKIRTLIISGIIIFLAIVAFAVISFIQNLQYNATIDILVAPSFATVEINGKTYKTEGTIKLKPGNYTVTISAEDFTTQEFPLILDKDSTSNIYTYLIPTDGTLNWYINHPREDMILTSIGSKNAAIIAEEYYAKYPVSTILPIIVVENNPTWVEYRIDGGQFDECESKEFCIKITDTTGGNRNHAIQKIQDGGFNPNDYEIIYKSTPIEPIDQSTIDQIYQQYGLN